MAEKNEIRINNTQRREFAKIAGGIIEEKLRKAIAEADIQRSIARERAAEELGVAELDRQIAGLEEEIKLLEKKREKLGFGTRYGHIIPGSVAARWIDNYREQYKEDVDKLRSAASLVKEHLWASQTLDEAQRIMEKVRGL